jgi:hypothetical protein
MKARLIVFSQAIIGSLFLAEQVGAPCYMPAANWLAPISASPLVHISINKSFKHTGLTIHKGVAWRGRY